MLIHRLPRRESIVAPSSHCPRCGEPIRPWDNVPALSYLLLRGRCRYCLEPITPRYLIVEIVAGALAAGAVIAVFASNAILRWYLTRML